MIAEMSRGVLFDADTFQLVVSVTIVTLALTPYLISFGPWLAARMRTRQAAPSAASAAVTEGHVVVVGYGPTGEAVARRLEAGGFTVHAVDLNRRLCERGALDGHTAHMGDATHPEVLEHAGVGSIHRGRGKRGPTRMDRAAVWSTYARSPRAPASSSERVSTDIARCWRRPAQTPWSMKKSRWAVLWRTS